MSANREPMWYCHECQAEMRPLMTPDPHCASCRGTFVEMMDDPGDDPRAQAVAFVPSLSDDSQRPRRDGDEERRPVGGMANILDLISALTGPSGGQPSNSGNRGGMRVVINGPGVRTVQFGGPNTLGHGGPRDGSIPRLSDYIASTTGEAPPTDGSPTRRAPAPLLASYLLSSMLNGGQGNSRGPAPMGFFDPFEMLSNGQFGDYVVNEQALEHVLNELMANGAGQQTDPPAPENVIEDLPRVVLEDGHQLLNDSCSICHEPFNAALAASLDAGSDMERSTSSATNNKEKDSPPLLIGVTLPCNHAFHEDCILPWLRMKSTCPVCRKSVLPDAQNPSAEGPSTSNSSQQQRSGRARDSRGADDPYIPGAWDTLD
ncbi:hypothetical protein JB92DRAFT_2984566 [Gautieria morchelliformis]|nr:hypothetical protein JB92DRAFT_2984566 [Gautieria morchelliformis]